MEESYEALKNIAILRKLSTRKEFAAVLGVKTSTLTHILYVLKPSTQYDQFELIKRSGGKRVINAPKKGLKHLQSRLSKLLQDCFDEILESRFPQPKIKDFGLAHGFIRNRSILTNARQHIHKKNVLNIDLEDFFNSFNFGRVRGFFIKNKEFGLHPDIATLIAQIACYDNKLPQGSPCSPVISNLITHSLDIRLAELARRNSCFYTRYADDITFSTRKSEFPKQIMREEDGGKYFPGKKLKSDITRSGFAINDKKTRIQYKDSRQDVTGLVVNYKPNVKREYWRTVRAQCHSIFQTGEFKKHTHLGLQDGNINELEGQLNFIDQVDFFNRKRKKQPLSPLYEEKKHGSKKLPLLSSREKTFHYFLYYRLFYGNESPTILCEGKTDNIYLKSAINILSSSYPKLARTKTKTTPYKLLVKFVRYTKRTNFILQLDGGASFLKEFVREFSAHYDFYNAPKPSSPVIIVLDNDGGFKELKNILINIKTLKIYPKPKLEEISETDIRKADFIHVQHNLYVVLTPLGKKDKHTDIESLFDDETRLIRFNGRCFNTEKKRDAQVDLSKDAFAKSVVSPGKNDINFDGFKALLSRIEKTIIHYNTV